MGGLIWIIVIVVVISEIKKFQRKNGQRVKPNVPRQQQYMRPDQTKVGQQNVRPNQMPRQQQNVRPNQMPRQQQACARIRYLGSRMCARTRWQDGRMCARTRCRDSGRRVQAGLPWQAAADRSLIRRRMTY